MKVSIIIPVYNTAPYLKKCLESCMNQTYANIEILVINDGSTDESGQILDEIAKTDDRIRVFHQENAGVVAARNVGIENATGEWIMFVDSDDWMALDAVEVLLSHTKNEVDIVISNFIYVVNNKILLNKKFISEETDLTNEVIRKLFSGEVNCGLCGKIYNKKLFFQTISDNSQIIAEDFYLLIQLILNSKKINIIDYSSYYYFQRANSISHKVDSKANISRLLTAFNIIKIVDQYGYLVINEIKDCTDFFIINSLFSYLKYGGLITENDIFNHIRFHTLKNKNAIKLVPFWRIGIIKIFYFSNFFGRVIRKLFLFIHKFFSSKISFVN